MWAVCIKKLRFATGLHPVQLYIWTAKAESAWHSEPSWNSDMEGTPRNVLVTPLHCQDIVTPFLDDISDVVLMAAQMLDGHLFTRYCRSMDAN